MIKDWTKEITNENFISWYKGKGKTFPRGDFKTLAVKKINWNYEDISKKWVVSSGGKILDAFKTKSQALSFAKSYMRTH